jgi:ribosomal protein S18 acetylase RimI-like enzyme
MTIALEPIAPGNALAFGSTYAGESLFSDADWLKRAAQWSSERSVGYLAMLANAPCGIAATFLDETDPRVAHLVSMWVDPSHWRTGVGRILVDAIRAWAEKRGVHTLLLNVTSSNATAIEFYKRNGFAFTGKTEPYPNDPQLCEYVMSLALSARNNPS